ncbi:hypothetical protein ACFPES_30940 [Paenibacillus sp. GCM10023248]|uniref:hypothetical protein n=1 Tax=unclassified Paenibacillus TaxID=185978 RepID=UPI0023794BA0|nr:hypothetical protein [Paenibacillus sp. MAHUQ-63]MDD9271460.1 hypothetical protein [Paenibacillus sp. MAHUQ-63]
MKKEIDGLIECFEREMVELQQKLRLKPDDEYLKGKISGIKTALTVCRMYNRPEDGHPIDVIIDTPM